MNEFITKVAGQIMKIGNLVSEQALSKIDKVTNPKIWGRMIAYLDSCKSDTKVTKIEMNMVTQRKLANQLGGGIDSVTSPKTRQNVDNILDSQKLQQRKAASVDTEAAEMLKDTGWASFPEDIKINPDKDIMRLMGDPQQKIDLSSKSKFSRFVQLSSAITKKISIRNTLGLMGNKSGDIAKMLHDKDSVKSLISKQKLKMNEAVCIAGCLDEDNPDHGLKVLNEAFNNSKSNRKLVKMAKVITRGLDRLPNYDKVCGKVMMGQDNMGALFDKIQNANEKGNITLLDFDENLDPETSKEGCVQFKLFSGKKVDIFTENSSEGKIMLKTGSKFIYGGMRYNCEGAIVHTIVQVDTDIRFTFPSLSMGK